MDAAISSTAGLPSRETEFETSTVRPQPPSEIDVRRTRIVLLVCLAGFLGTFLTGVSLRFPGVLYARNLSIPVAVSWLYHGSSGYTAFQQVADVITNEGLGERGLQDMVHLSNIDRSQLAYIPADDKGRVDLAIFSFALFGPHIWSLYLGFFVLLGVSAGCFVLEFRRDPGALAALAIYSLSLWAVTPALAITKELYSFTNPRVFGVLAVVPTLHLVFLLGRRFSWLGFGLCVIQSLLLAECFHTRSTDVWPFIAIAAMAALAFWRLRDMGLLWPAVIGLCALPALLLYQRLAYDPAYFTEKGTGHIFWHNVAMGFGLDPYFAQKYGLAIEDSTVIQLVSERASKDGGPDLVRQIFGPPGAIYPDVAEDLQLYDRLAKGIVFDIAKDNPAETVKLFAFYKPRLLVKTVLWTAGLYQQDLESLAIADQAPSIASVEERAEKGIYLRPLTVLPLLGIMLLLLTRVKVRIGAVVAVMLAGSLIAPLAIYPAIHTLAVSLLLITVLCQLVALWLLAVVVQYSFFWLEEDASPGLELEPLVKEEPRPDGALP